MGVAARVASAVGRRAAAALVGRPIDLPPRLVQRFPELAGPQWRRGGLPVLVGGWALGQRSAAAITLWRTIFVAPGVPLDAELLLHEVRHVHHFATGASFPLRYIWESLRHGYHHNRFEADARAFARERLRAARADLRRGDR